MPDLPNKPVEAVKDSKKKAPALAKRFNLDKKEKSPEHSSHSDYSSRHEEDIISGEKAVKRDRVRRKIERQNFGYTT